MHAEMCVVNYILQSVLYIMSLFTSSIKMIFFNWDLLHALDCTNRSNLEMEPKYLIKNDVQLNPNIFKTKNY